MLLKGTIGRQCYFHPNDGYEDTHVDLRINVVIVENSKIWVYFYYLRYPI